MAGAQLGDGGVAWWGALKNVDAVVGVVAGEGGRRGRLHTQGRGGTGERGRRRRCAVSERAGECGVVGDMTSDGVS